LRHVTSFAAEERLRRTWLVGPHQLYGHLAIMVACPQDDSHAAGTDDFLDVESA
jgi:hypothetical protein